MKTKTNLSKLMSVLVLLDTASLSANANNVKNNDFMSLLLDHYESDYVMDEELNYYRNFLRPSNQDESNALTVDRVNEGENAFTLYRYDIDNPDVLYQVASLYLSCNSSATYYTITYQDDNQVYHPADNIMVPTQGVLTVTDGVIEMDSIVFVDRFAADVSQNMHPNGYGYVLKSFDDEKSTNVVMVPVMKTGADIGGFFTQQEVIGDVEAQLIPGVKNANVEMYLQSDPSIYYYTLERGDNTTPNEIISKLQRRSDGNYIEVSNALNQDFYVFPAPGDIDRYDNNIVTGEYGDYMTYVPVVWTFGFNRVDYDTDFQNNSYGSPILKTGVADVNPSVTGYVNMSDYWYDEDGKKCVIFNPILTIESTMPEYASVEYEPYMYRVWRKCNTIRNYLIDDAGHLINDSNTPRESFMLIAEENNGSAIIQLGSEDGKELAFGATLDSKDGGISFLVRLYYKKVTRDSEQPIMYYVVEKEINWDNIVIAVGVGDVNGDGITNIQDVTELIDYLLNENGYYYTAAADVNGDGTVDIADVTALIDLLLAGD